MARQMAESPIRAVLVGGLPEVPELKKALELTTSLRRAPLGLALAWAAEKRPLAMSASFPLRMQVVHWEKAQRLDLRATRRHPRSDCCHPKVQPSSRHPRSDCCRSKVQPSSRCFLRWGCCRWKAQPSSHCCFAQGDRSDNRAAHRCPASIPAGKASGH